MSGETSQGDPTATPGGDVADASDVIPVEVEAPAQADGEAVVDPCVALEQKIATLEKEKKETYDKFLRSVADLDNLRKRQRRELDETKLETKQKILKEMFVVVDNLERAIEHAVVLGEGKEGKEPNPIVDGVRLVLRQFQTAFERLDVVPVEAEGHPFDPNLHEAISQQESDKPPGTVIQVLQRGYKSAERLLRPSLVIVAKAKAEA